MKKSFLILGVVFVSMFLFSPVFASIISDIQPAQNIIYDEEVVVNNVMRVDSLHVGNEKNGGVTYFNGSIVNIGDDMPVTFGDDVRIDGAIWRGVVGDNKPVKINDDLEIDGDITIAGDMNIGSSYIASHWLHTDGIQAVYVLRVPHDSKMPSETCDEGNVYLDTSAGNTKLYGCDENGTWDLID